jgi:predicted DNA-binding transcriptional regulator YafY
MMNLPNVMGGFYPAGRSDFDIDICQDAASELKLGGLADPRGRNMPAIFDKHMELMQYLHSAHIGRTYQEICAHLEVSDSTSRKMIRALKDYFEIPDDEFSETGEKRFRILGIRWRLRDFEQDIHVLGLAAELFRKEGQIEQSARLRALQNQMTGTLKPNEQIRIAPDLELLGQEEGWAMRPGPRSEVNADRLTELRQALLGRKRLKVDYKCRRDNVEETIIIEPHGILFGVRNYLVAFASDDTAKMPRLFVRRFQESSATGLIWAPHGTETIFTPQH